MSSRRDYHFTCDMESFITINHLDNKYQKIFEKVFGVCNDHSSFGDGMTIFGFGICQIFAGCIAITYSIFYIMIILSLQKMPKKLTY